MNDLNIQPQNPNIPLSGGGDSSPVQAPIKKENYLFWIIIAAIIVVGGLVWWYIDNMAVEMPVVQQPQINQEVREDIMISNDIQSSDPGDLDKEFQEVDKDIDSL